MADFDDEMLAFAQSLADRTAERHQRLHQISLTGQKHLRFDMEMQVKQDQKRYEQMENCPPATSTTSFVTQLKNFATTPSSSSSASAKFESITGSPFNAKFKLESLSSNRSQALSPLKPHNLTSLPQQQQSSPSSFIKPTVFTPPKVDFRDQLKTVRFSSHLDLQNHSSICPINISHSAEDGTVATSSSLSTYGQQPSSMERETFEKDALEQVHGDNQTELMTKPKITGMIEKSFNSTKPNVENTAMINSKIHQLRSTFDRKTVEEPTITNHSYHLSTPKPLAKKSIHQFETMDKQPEEVSKPPEHLCVSDKKKLFESAIKRETENAKRNHEQLMFLSRAKNPNILINEQEEEEVDEHEFNVKKRKENESEFEKQEADEKQTMYNAGFDSQQVIINMQQDIENISQQKVEQLFEEASAVKSLNDQEMYPESVEPIVSIQLPECVVNECKESLQKCAQQDEPTCQKFDIEHRKQLLHQRLFGSIHPYTTTATCSQTPSPLQQLDSAQISPITALQQPRKKSFELYPKLAQSNETDQSLKDQQLTVNVEEDISKSHELSHNLTMMPRTLSMVRREQKARAAQNFKPSRINRLSEEEEEKQADQQLLHRMWLQQIQNKIKFLNDEIKKHEEARVQSCNAVNHCLKKDKFHGTLQQLHSERIYLITDQKRFACEIEVKRLDEIMKKYEKSFESLPEMLIRPPAVGQIVVHLLNFPLKSDFIISQASGEDAFDHHFFCIMRCGAQVLYTELLNSAEIIKQASSLCFRAKVQSSSSKVKQNFQEHSFVFNDLDNQFELHLDVYGMALKHGGKSLLPDSLKMITPRSPRKSKKVSACRFDYTNNCTFTRLAQTKLTKDNITDGMHELHLLEDCPIDGRVEIKCEVKVAYQIEMSDYLNFYDDSREYPVWSRRWCVLKGHCLTYWRFKEHQSSHPSMGMIDLRQCAGRQVGPASYEQCARPNTFVMTCVQSKEMESKEYLISADLKDEMNAWCKNLNQLLQSIRIWEKDFPGNRVHNRDSGMH